MSIGCEPSQVIDGRVPYSILDDKHGLKQKIGFVPFTDFIDEVLGRTQILYDNTKKKNMMHSYIGYRKIMTKKQEPHHCKKTTATHYNLKRIKNKNT